MKGCLHPLLTAKFSQQLHLIILRLQEKIGRNYWQKNHDQYFAVCSTGRFSLNHYQTKLYLIIYFNVQPLITLSGKKNSRDFKFLSKPLPVRKNNPSEPLRRKHDLVSQRKTIIWSGKIFKKYTSREGYGSTIWSRTPRQRIPCFSIATCPKYGIQCQP